MAHLATKSDNPELAFSPDGIDEMNRNIKILNGGKFHQPIYRVRWYEKGEKFAVGQKGNKPQKFVEAAKGTNLFFAVFTNEQGVRSYLTIPLNIMIDCQKIFGAKWDVSIEQYLKEQKLVSDDLTLLFILSPNDLVYLPTEEEQSNTIKDKERIYKVVSFSGYQMFCIKANVSSTIVNKVEFTTSNKMERAITGEMIKETCIPIKVDRLGNILQV